MIGQQISIQAARVPDTTAIYFGPKTLTYTALDRRSGLLATALSANGVKAGDRVAALLLNCPQFLELFFACAKLGAIFVPVNFRLVAREIALLLRGSTPAILFAGQNFDTILDTLRAGGDLTCPVSRVNDSIETGPADAAYEALLASAAEPLTALAAGMELPLSMMHSSGTTGLPKGALHSHGTTLASCMAKIIDFSLTEDDRAVVFGPLFHAGPLMDLALPLLIRGGSVVLGVSRGFDPDMLLRTLVDQGGTVVPIYPTMLRRVIASDLGAYDLSRLRLIISGGEAIAPSFLAEAQASLPHVEILNNYGSTEGGPITTFLRPGDHARKPGSVGRPSFGMAVCIAGEDGAPVPPDVTGEVLVRGPFVCVGYWNRPELTAAARRGAWWATGDLGWLDAEGYLWIAGRRSEMIKSGAENIYPTEVEDVIVTLDGVAEAGVVGVPDPDWGETPVAYVVPAAGRALDAAAVSRHCRANLAGYKVPRHIRFINALPRTGTNKIARTTLRRLFEQERAAAG